MLPDTIEEWQDLWDKLVGMYVTSPSSFTSRRIYRRVHGITIEEAQWLVGQVAFHIEVSGRLPPPPERLALPPD